MKSLITIAFTVTASLVFAQTNDIYAPVLRQIESNNLSLMSAGKRAEASRIANSTDLTPPDLEIELGYLWGYPAEKGSRKDVSVTQAFDFPTLYSRKRRLSKEKNLAANYELNASRTEILLEAKTVCIEIIYSNAMLRLYESRYNRADSLASSMKRMVELGEATQLDYNKALLDLTRVENELQKAATEHRQLLDELRRLNGGEPIEFNASKFPAAALPADFDSWFLTASERNPELRVLRQNSAVASSEIAVTKAASLPKLSLGYLGEFEKGTNYQGITFGFSLPLWENRRKVSQAKAEALATSSEYADAQLSYRASAESLFRQTTAMRDAVERYHRTITGLRNDLLLQKSYSYGQISFHEYLEEMNNYFEFVAGYIQAQRDYHLSLARLNAFDL